jgi:UDP-glucose 4-epimerase
MKILVTGGAGYIGSHTCVELLDNGYEVVIVDNLYNSKEKVISDIEKITEKKIKFYKGDVRDKDLLREIFKQEKIDAVIHFAGLKAVGESVEKPILYYQNNIDSTLNLCEVMNEFNVKKIIFSSSATVYGDPEKLPITEDMRVGNTTNPYGTSKLYIEGILKDIYVSDNDWSIILLRYFNPIGAHESGLLGENPNGIPNNLMPYIVKVANGELECLSIFGDDYSTPDGTGVRDYIHVVDLARGHVKALNKLMKDKGVNVYNLGTGNGYSVLEIVKTFEDVNGVKVNKKIVARREGDIAECYADSSKAYKELGWKAELDLSDMVSSAYNYAINNKK